MRRLLLKIHRRLAKAYGLPQRRRLDPVSELVSTILSQNTNDRLRDLAYGRLRERFPTWDQVRDAPRKEIIAAIRPAGLARQKGPRIKRALQRITQERGKLTLDFLRRLPTPQAKAWLTSIPGVGPKTAAIVLLFSLGKRAFPVDTHIHRVARRLGLIAPKVSSGESPRDPGRVSSPAEVLRSPSSAHCPRPAGVPGPAATLPGMRP